MKNNIIIAGVPRAGKSTVSHILSQEYGYQHVSMDSIIAGFEKCFPETGVSTYQGLQPILDLVDRDALAVITAVEISYLDKKVQQMLYDYMIENNEICMAFQLYALREYLEENKTVTRMELIRIMNENAPVDTSNRFQCIVLTKPKLKKYFPTFYTKSQMEKVIFDLLAGWKKANKEM